MAGAQSAPLNQIPRVLARIARCDIVNTSRPLSAAGFTSRRIRRRRVFRRIFMYIYDPPRVLSNPAANSAARAPREDPPAALSGAAEKRNSARYYAILFSS